MNKMTAIGNLTADPTSRTTQDGKTVCAFTVAVNRRKKSKDGEKEADFFRVSAFSGLGENCQKYLTKGKKVCVIGQVSVHPYLNKEGNPAASLELYAEDVEFLSPAGNIAEQNAQPNVPVNMTPVETSELPF